MKKTSTVALIVAKEGNGPFLVETLCDEHEIQFMESSLRDGHPNPLDQIYELRAKQSQQESEFGDYIEDLLSQPFLNPEIQNHGVRWLKSKIRIEEYQKVEREAARVIAQFAYKIFQEDPEKVDFFLASPTSQVRIRVFLLATPEPLAKIS